MEDFVLISLQCKLTRLPRGMLGDEMREQNVTQRGARERGRWEMKSTRGRVCPRKSTFSF